MARLIGREVRTSQKDKTVWTTLHFVEDFKVGQPNVDGMKCFSEVTNWDTSMYQIGKDYKVNYEKGFKDQARFAGMEEIPEQAG